MICSNLDQLSFLDYHSPVKDHLCSQIPRFPLSWFLVDSFAVLEHILFSSLLRNDGKSFFFKLHIES